MSANPPRLRQGSPDRRSSAASALVNGRCWRMASWSSRSTTARAPANERSIRVARKLHEALVDQKLTVGEELDQHRAQQRLIGRRQRHHRQGLEPRGEVTDRRPSSWTGAVRVVNSTNARSSRARLRRWNSARSSKLRSEMSSITSAPVASAEGSVSSDSARAARKRAPAVAAQIAARWLLPEPSGPASDDGARGPVREALDQRKRCRIGRPAEEILARKAFGMRQRKRKLARSGRRRHGGQLGRPPV